MKTDVIGYIVIHGSKAKPISTKELMVNCNTSEQPLRDTILKARASGISICANRKGYWYAENLEDVKEQYNSLASRVDSMLSAMKGLSEWMERNDKKWT